MLLLVPEPLRIALVDDDLSVRRSVPRLLRSAGYETRTFASAEELLESGFLDKTACLLLDIHLGRTSGFTLLERLNLAGNPPPTIFITAHHDPDAAERSRILGARACLLKPFDARVLLDAVSAAITGMLHP